MRTGGSRWRVRCFGEAMMGGCVGSTARARATEAKAVSAPVGPHARV